MDEIKTLIPHLLRPARGNAAGVIIVFAILLAIAANAGLLGIPLGAIIFSWFFKYAYILFDHVVRGYDEPPALDIKMLNPLDEQRPLGQVAIIAVFTAVTLFTAARVPPPITIALGVALTAALPATTAVLGMEGNLLAALNPVVLYRLISGLGIFYLLILILIAAYALILGLIAKVLWLPILLAAAMFLVLSAFSALAGVIYHRRHELGLETWHSPERTAELVEKADRKRHIEIVTEAYGQVRVGQHVKAWNILQTWLQSRDGDVAEYRWLLSRVGSWTDPRYANRLTEEYVEKLIALKRNGEALDAVASRLNKDVTFRPATAASTFLMAQLAAQGGGMPGVARRLLSDFDQRFPDDATAAAANALARHLGQ